MEHNLSFETAWGLFKRLPEYTATDLDALGVQKAHLELVSGGRPWKIDNSEIVLRTLYAFIFGTLKILRLPPIVVPSEYIAPIVAAAVNPCNMLLACIWLAQEKQTGAGVLELSARAQPQQQFGLTSADQLFALVCEIMSTDGVERYREKFATAMGYEIQVAADEEQMPTKQRKR